MLRRLTIILIIASVCAAIALPACAGSFLYSSSKREIKAGVLVTPIAGNLDPDPPLPFVFFIMDQRYDIKPRGWEFVNPLSVGVYDTSAATLMTLNPKSCAGYWKVNLRRTVLDNLLKFDLLYLCANSSLSLTTDDLLKLRNFVDAGGVLWIDQPATGAPMNLTNSFFISGLHFYTGGGSPPATVISRHHPLLSSPYWLSEQEINSLGLAHLSGCYLQVGKVDNATGSPLEPIVLMPVVKNLITGGDAANKFAYIAGVHYGSGAIVATAGGIGQSMSVGSGAPFSGCIDMRSPDVWRHLVYAPGADLKLAYNICNWSASWMSLRKDVRRAACSTEDMGGAMIERWLLPNPPATSVETSAVFYKNIFLYTSGNVVYALDAVPDEDLDGDGNPDDGQNDPAGSPFDIVWQTLSDGPQYSAPTVAEVRVAGGAAFEVVVVQGADSHVYAWQAFPTVSGRLSGAAVPVILPPSPLYGGASGTPFAVASHGGWIYQNGLDGLFHAYNPGGAAWVCPNVITSLVTYTYKSAPVIGTIENDDNGAVVDVAFSAGKMTTTGGTPGPNDQILTLALAIRNERLRRSTFGSGNGVVGYYDTIFRGRKIFGDAGDPDYPEVWATDANGGNAGILWPPLNMPADGGPNIPGVGCFGVSQNGTVQPPPEYIIYANYKLDFPAPGGSVSPQIDAYTLRPEYVMRPDAPGPLKLNGAPALGRDGMSYVCAQRPSGGAVADLDVGEVQSVQLGYNGATANSHWDLKWRYPLHAGVNAGVLSQPGVVVDHTLDLVDQGPGVALRQLQPSTSPALAGDKLFVTAWGNGPKLPSPDGTSFYSNSALLCFKAKPDFVIRIHEPLVDPTTRRKRDVRIWQPDPLFPSCPGMSLPNDAVHVPSQMIDYRRGTISISDFNVLTPACSGFARSPLTPAVPVLVFVDGVQLPDAQVDLSQWNNLLWYMVPYHETRNQPCSGVHAPPVVIGDHVYFQCDDGWLFSVDTETGVTNGGQVFCVSPTYSSDPGMTKHVQWIYPLGGTPATAVTAGGPTACSIAAANGLMAVAAADGLHGFDNPLTLVADNHRLVELDGGSKVTWSVESINKVQTTTSGSQSMESQTINRPAMAKIMNSGDYLVADTGNNQILHIDRAGNVTWWMTSFSDPDGILRPGDPLELSGPTDVVAWAGMESDGTSTFTVLHHLIADGGNHRIVDVVDKYDSTGALVAGQQLNWVSHTLELGKLYEFRNVQLWAHPSDMGHQYVLAAISNYSVFDAPYQTQQPGGSVALLDYRTINASNFQVTMRTGDIARPSAFTGLYTAIKGLGATSEPLTGLRYLHRDYKAGGTWHDLLCTATGVYEVDETGTLVRTWITSPQYSALVRKIEGGPPDSVVTAPLNATSAKIVGANRILISNGYSGPTLGGMFPSMDFHGEVFEIENAAVRTMMWYAPLIRLISGPPPHLQQVTDNGGNIEQPSCVDRVQ